MTTAAGSTLNFTSGTWNGTGSAAVNGAFNWTAGSLAGSGTVTATGPITLGGGASNLLTMSGTKTLVLDGDATWSGLNMWINNGNTFRINPGRVLTNTGNCSSGGTVPPAGPTTSGAPSARPTTR